MSNLTILTRSLFKIMMMIFIVVHQTSPSSASEHQTEVSCDPVLSQRCEQVCDDSVCVDSYENEAQNSPVCQCEEILEEESNYNCLDAEISTMCATKCDEISDSDGNYYQAKICTSDESNIGNSDMSPICVCQYSSLEEDEREKRASKETASSTTSSPSTSSGEDDPRVPAAKDLQESLLVLISLCEGIKKNKNFKEMDKYLENLNTLVMDDAEKLDKLIKTSKE